MSLISVQMYDTIIPVILWRDLVAVAKNKCRGRNELMRWTKLQEQDNVVSVCAALMDSIWLNPPTPWPQCFKRCRSCEDCCYSATIWSVCITFKGGFYSLPNMGWDLWVFLFSSFIIIHNQKKKNVVTQLWAYLGTWWIGSQTAASAFCTHKQATLALDCPNSLLHQLCFALDKRVGLLTGY